MVNNGSDFHWSFLSLLVSSVAHSRKKPLSYKWKHLKSLSVLEEKRLLIVQVPLQTDQNSDGSDVWTEQSDEKTFTLLFRLSRDFAWKLFGKIQ